MGKGWFDPTRLKFILERMVYGSGCGLLLGTKVIGAIKDGDTITHCVIANSDGISAIRAKAFVDASADGAFSVMSGADFHSGNNKGYNQAISLRFIMTGIDIKKVSDYLTSLGENSGEYPAFSTASVHGSGRFKLEPIFYSGYEEGLLTLQDIKYFQCFSMPGRKNCLAFNCPELGSSKNVLDAEFLSERHTAGLEAILRLNNLLRLSIPGFEDAYICEVAPMVGIRESRRIVCEYMLTGKDVAGYRKFPDYIATSNYPVDIHDAGDTGLTYKPTKASEMYYHVPFRSLIVKGVDNLFVAGRCIGADFIAQSSVRVQSTCRSTGEAAGIGTALIVQNQCASKEVSGVDVRALMESHGAKFV